MSRIFYAVANLIGFRLHRFTNDRYGGHRIVRSAWLWIPKTKAGSYRETVDGWVHVGYGAHL